MQPDPSIRVATESFDLALSALSNQTYVLRLYLTGSTYRSMQAIETIKSLCELHLGGRYALEIIDLYQQPERAAADQIIAAPTLIKSLPLPLRRLIGDLTDINRVLIALNLHPGPG